MIEMPKFLKAERDMAGQLAIKFEDLDPGAKDKEFTKCFTELRAGISWPIRAVPGYLCVLGLFAGVKFGTPNSLMLVYEKEFAGAADLMTDAYNKAHDLRFGVFYSDLGRPEWQGFISEFNRKVRTGLGAREVRLKHSPFPTDFVLGKDRIVHFINQKAFVMPTKSNLCRHLLEVRPADLETDHPEYKFPSVNAFRYLIVAWERTAGTARVNPGEERQVTVKGWS